VWPCCSSFEVRVSILIFFYAGVKGHLCRASQVFCPCLLGLPPSFTGVQTWEAPCIGTLPYILNPLDLCPHSFTGIQTWESPCIGAPSLTWAQNSEAPRIVYLTLDIEPFRSVDDLYMYKLHSLCSLCPGGWWIKWCTAGVTRVEYIFAFYFGCTFWWACEDWTWDLEAAKQWVWPNQLYGWHGISNCIDVQSTQWLA
jgi:hypothetical protein